MAATSFAVMIRLGSQGFSEATELFARITLATFALSVVSVVSAAVLYWT